MIYWNNTSIIFFILFPLLLSSQPNYEWITTFESSTWDEGHCVRETMDNGFIIGGLTGAQGTDVYLSKTDENGHSLWTMTYGGSGWDEARMVHQTSDGGYITAGRTTSFGATDSDIYVIKTNSQGDTLWTGMYGGAGHDDSQWIGEITGEGYIIAGQTFSYGAGGSDIILIKIDLEGNIIWLETYGDAGDEDAQWAQFTSDDGIIITGSIDIHGTGNDDIYVVKTDLNGEVLWTKTYGGADTDLSLSIEEVSAGGYIISGQTESFGNGNDDVYLIRTDGDGDLLWEKTYGHVQADGGSSVQETLDGGFVIAGVLTTDEGGFDACVIKTDENGDSLWTKLYYSNIGWDNWDIAFSIQVTSDNGYVVTGLTGLYPEFDVFILKLSSDLENNFIVIDIPGDYPTIQAGINAASDGDTVLVQPGTYIENLNFNGKNIVVKSSNGAEETFIDGDHNGSVVLFNSGENRTSILKGFSLRNGNGTNLSGVNVGGGIFCFQSDPTLKDLIIGENHAGLVGVGGGIGLWGSSATIENVLVKGNSSASGGGIYTHSSDPVIKNVTAINNWTYGALDAGGGGMAFQESTPQLFRVNVSENSSGVNAGGLMFQQCENVVLQNITLSNNTVEFEGGSIYLYQTDIAIVNSIIWNDLSTVEILFHNVNNWGSVTVSFSDIQGGMDAIETNQMGTIYWEEGNLDSDPHFVDSGDYHLQGDSPCIDAGDPDLDNDGLTWEDDTDDQDADGTRMDMGAYEFTGSELATVIVDYVLDWNLVGLPVGAEDDHYLSLFPEAMEGTLYSFDFNYLSETVLSAGTGYWLRFNSLGSVSLSGNSINDLTLNLEEDWNLISGITDPIDINTIIDPDNIIIPGTFYGFGIGYEQSEILEPGKGYWLRTTVSGEITISSSRKHSKKKPFINPLEFASKISINGQILYFGEGDISLEEKLSYSLPPKPPEGAFDVRFSGDWKYVNNYGEIELMNPPGKLYLSYDIKPSAEVNMYWVLISESGKEYFLEGSGALSEISGEKFILERKTAIPMSYTLYQNYPNPFNPVTTLSYDLPEESHITLSIFDLMGREILQLVNSAQDEGHKSVQWDATNSFGEPVSAGIYIYKIQAGEFNETKKMILMK